MVFALRQIRCFSFTVAIGMDVLIVTRVRHKFHDFEAVLDRSKRRQSTKELLFKNQHISVSVSLADTLDREPVYICSKDPEEIIGRF